MKKFIPTFLLVMLLCFWSHASNANAKLKTFEFPEIGLSIQFPHESVKTEETKELIRYQFEIKDTGGRNIGSGVFSIYPNYVNNDVDKMVNEIREVVKNDKIGDASSEVGYGEGVLKGMYHSINILSKYTFTGYDFSVKRHDYLIKGCVGLIHITFTIPSYNAYLTQDDRDFIVYKSFNWVQKETTNSEIGVQYALQNGVFIAEADNKYKTIVFHSCVEKLKSQIVLSKLSVGTNNIKEVADKHFLEVKTQNPQVSLEYFKSDNLTIGDYVANKYKVTTEDGTAYNIIDYIFNNKGVNYIVRAQSTCFDIDGCGIAFSSEVERFINTIKTIDVVKKEEPKPKEEEAEEDDWYWFFD